MHRCGCSGGVGAAPLRFAQSVLDLFPPDWLPGGLGNSVDGAHELAATTGCHLGMESQCPGIKVIHKRCGPFNAAGGDATLLGCLSCSEVEEMQHSCYPEHLAGGLAVEG